MRKQMAVTFAVAASVLTAPAQLSAQVKVGYTDVGAVVGLGNLGGANVSFGGRFERIVKKLPGLGDGLLGIGVSADVYSYDVGVGSFRFIPVGATANYHFKLDPKRKLDLFVGAGLGYSFLSCPDFDDLEELLRLDFVSAVSPAVSRTAAAGSCGVVSGGVYFIGRAGGRYFLKPNLALYGDVGAGAATLNLGLTIKLR